MGQTLTHGVYLPNEGERNCYSGLASNWRLLDGAIGTVAAHTTAIAGKADISHTHGNISNDGKVGTTANLPLITGTGGVVQAGAFGNQANTFCEGNDSRLSDARTPVAHTHTKSDVTDLLNSANTWTGEQTFSQTIQGNAATASAFDTAKSITLTGAVTGTVSGTNSWEIATVFKTGSARTGGTVTNPYFKIASWEVAPNKYFGAILQIQNKCYPQNTATLTLSVRTKTDATLQSGYSILSNAIGVLPSNFILCYKEVTGKVLCELYYYITSAFNGIRFSVISEGLGIQEGNSLFNTVVVYQDPAGIAALPSDYTAIQTSIGTYTQDFIPDSNNTYDLGSSSYQWNNLYAKNYYYNGIQWGLNQNNTWTNDNTFKGIYQNQGDTNYIIPRGTSTVKGDLTTSGFFSLMFKDKNNGSLATSGIGYLSLGQNSSGSYATIGVETIGSTDNARHINSISLKIDSTTNDNTAQFYPVYNNSTDLGTSTNKWKTLNGVNPGALSLPGAYSSSVTEYITDKTGGNNAYTAPADGWVGIQANSATLDSGNFIFMGRTSDGATYFAQNASSSITSYWSNQYHGCILLPVTSGTTYGIRCKCDSVDARFYKANGNVS